MSYSSKRRDAAIADDYLANHLACRTCKGMAPREDLSRYGAQCEPCHTRQCSDAAPRWMPNRPLTSDEQAKLRARIRNGLKRLVGQQRDNPKAWAHRLAERASEGEQLSRVQREAMQEALGLAAPPTEPVSAPVRAGQQPELV